MSLHFVLDGYNLVKQDEHLAVLKLESGRLGLLKLIESRQLQGSKSNPVTVVFDGQLGASKEQHSPGITVVFTSFETADDWIKRFVEESENTKSIVVVTDDREIRYYVRALGATLMGTREFLEGRGSFRGNQKDRRREADAVRKLKRPQSDKKEISSVMENKITSEFTKVWLKDKK